MTIRFDFKNGIYLGILLVLLVLLCGFLKVQDMENKAAQVATIDLTQFEYQDLDGNEVKLSDYSNKHILLNFWATWCPPCIGEFPLLNETLSLVNEDMVFLMVSYESLDKIRAYAKESSYNFVFLKSDNFLLEGISTIPQSFILNKEGATVHHHPSIFESSSVVLADSLRGWVMD